MSAEILDQVKKVVEMRNDKFGGVDEKEKRELGSWIALLNQKLREIEDHYSDEVITHEDSMVEILELLAICYRCLDQHGVVPIDREEVQNRLPLDDIQ